jgi:hypothetical protein
MAISSAGSVGNGVDGPKSNPDEEANRPPKQSGKQDDKQAGFAS